MKTYSDGMYQAMATAEEVRMIAVGAEAVKLLDLVIRSIAKQIQIEIAKEAAKRIQQGSFF